MLFLVDVSHAVGVSDSIYRPFMRLHYYVLRVQKGGAMLAHEPLQTRLTYVFESTQK